MGVTSEDYEAYEVCKALISEFIELFEQSPGGKKVGIYNCISITRKKLRDYPKDLNYRRDCKIDSYLGQEVDVEFLDRLFHSGRQILVKIKGILEYYFPYYGVSGVIYDVKLMPGTCITDLSADEQEDFSNYIKNNTNETVDISDDNDHEEGPCHYISFYRRLLVSINGKLYRYGSDDEIPNSDLYL